MLTAVLTTGLWVAIASPLEAAQTHHITASRLIVAAPYAGENTGTNTTRWIADPKRGWIPIDEIQREDRANRPSPQDRKGDKLQEFRKENRPKKNR